MWEVRVQFSGNIFRLYGFLDGDELLILAHGLAKMTQKTLAKDIDITEARKRDYLSRRRT